MVYKSFHLQLKQPTKGDWATTVQSDLKELDIVETLSDIKRMPKNKFKNLVKMKIKENAYNYLMNKRKSNWIFFLRNGRIFIALMMKWILMENNEYLPYKKQNDKYPKQFWKKGSMSMWRNWNDVPDLFMKQKKWTNWNFEKSWFKYEQKKWI
jgi:hypothetical protein